MYCNKCGQKIRSDAVICPHCGCETGYKKPGTPKKGLGILLGMFLGVIGLIIGMCMYESDSVERKTFMKGWTIGFIITIILSVISTILYFVIIGAAVGAAGMYALII